MNQASVTGLEHSCNDWIKCAPGQPGIERFEAFFSGHGFTPHRHDTYAVGYTCRGVQSFGYRGATQHCTPGQIFVLHPDELHDGRAGTETGFRYRILYLEPRLVHEALGFPALPFVRDAVTNDPRLARAIVPALEELDAPLDALDAVALVSAIADALAALGGMTARKALGARHWRAVNIAVEILDAAIDETPSAARLETATGLSRYALARHFRACLGTSPNRYLIMRRLAQARALIGEGMPLADAAIACGFADQSHMTRHFKKSFGLTPGRWAANTIAA